MRAEAVAILRSDTRGRRAASACARDSAQHFYSFARRNNCLFNATMIVDSDINPAAIAGISVSPHGANTPATNGIATTLWQTRYGQVLLRTLAVFSVTASIGLYNWRRVTPVLDSGAVGMHRLQCSAAAKLTIGIAVLLVTAILVATPTALDI